LPDLVTVSGQYGTHRFEDFGNHSAGVFGTTCGVAGRPNGSLIAVKECVRVTGVRRSDFYGNTALTVFGVLRPLPDGLKVYAQATRQYITVAEARVYSNDFTVYLDKPAAEGGKPRFIVAL